jgi:hypothetical protein
LRRDLVRKRVRVIERYLKLKEPSFDETRAHCEELGLSKSQFYRLVKVWRDNRDPSKLAGAGANVGMPRNRKYAVSPEADRIIQAVIGELGTEAEPIEVQRRVEERCTTEGIRAPGRTTTWSRLQQARTSAPPGRAVATPALVIGRVWPDLPTRGTRTAMPEVAIAMLVPERVIIAFDIGIESEPNIAIVIAQALAEPKGTARHRELHLAERDAGQAEALIAALGEVPPRITVMAVQRVISAQLGATLGGIRIHNSDARLALGRSALRSALNTQLERAEAVALISAAIIRHNNRVGNQLGGMRRTQTEHAQDRAEVSAQGPEPSSNHENAVG